MTKRNGEDKETKNIRWYLKDSKTKRKEGILNQFRGTLDAVVDSQGKHKRSEWSAMNARPAVRRVSTSTLRPVDGSKLVQSVNSAYRHNSPHCAVRACARWTNCSGVSPGATGASGLPNLSGGRWRGETGRSSLPNARIPNTLAPRRIYDRINKNVIL